MLTEVLELRFSTKANIKNIPPEGKHYKGVIGKQYSVLNSFMIRKEIHGPSWLTIKGVQAENDSENPSNFVIFRLNTENSIESFTDKKIPAISVLSMQTQKFKGKISAIALSNVYNLKLIK